MKSKRERETRETQISVSVNMADAPEPRVDTGIPFFDHMLTAMAFHGKLGLTAQARGDVEVDAHHTVEDLGLVLGDALNDIREGDPTVRRFGHAAVPMDDALAEVTIDLGGRPYLVWNLDFPQEYAGSFQLPLLREFMQALAIRSRCNLHVNGRYGENGHHVAEAVFKALGIALSRALAPGYYDSPGSTKGSL